MATYASAVKDGGATLNSDSDEQKGDRSVNDYNVLRSLSFGGLQLAVHVDTNDSESNVIGSPQPEGSADQSKMTSSWIQQPKNNNNGHVLNKPP